MKSTILRTHLITKYTQHKFEMPIEHQQRNDEEVFLCGTHQSHSVRMEPGQNSYKCTKCSEEAKDFERQFREDTRKLQEWETATGTTP